MTNPNDSQLTVEGVFRLVNSGQFGAAEEYCVAYLQKQPDDVNVLGLLGAILLKLGRPADARPVLEHATRLAPDFSKPFEDLGVLHLGEGDAKQAVRYFEKAVSIDASQPGAWAGLANAWSRLGEQKQAQAARRRYLELSPTGRLLDEASRLRTAGDVSRAEQICEELLAKEPNNTDALRLLAGIATDDERYIVAEGLLKRIVKLTSNHYLGYNELGRFLGDRGRIPEAAEQMKIAVRLDPAVVENHRVLGDLLSIVGREQDACDAYKAALEIDATDTPALLGSAHMLRILGKPDEAIAAYESSLSIRPDAGDAWWSLATMPGYAFSPAQLEVMRGLLEDEDLPQNARISVSFALARAAEKSQQYDDAWKHYELGNRLRRSQVSYDPVQTELTHDSIIETFTANLLNRVTRIDDEGPRPIFIVGMPRSGSTLLEQILASHSQIEGCGELPYIVMLSSSISNAQGSGKRYPESVLDMTTEQRLALGQNYLYQTRTHRKQDLSCFTDKMPANFSHIGMIHLALPDACIIDARRSPLDTCIANYRQLFAQGKKQSYDLFELADYYLEYRRIMDHWDEVLPGRVLRVQYEDVVADIESQARRILEYCGLPWEDECLNFFDNERAVNTASSEQVRQPIYAKSIEFWKNYDAHLDDLKDVLADVISGSGHETML
ncbi:MAG: sulfotransferase [Gammaproteobacteria bacterium]|nr:sulfotransferase [Gammaproteobacteria bacterium]